mmetsp:Transcript_16947/g.39677  ORF Transcript_16947/g.39677 Transcript_16947/m.39677 type:complete len:224 (+) Transcript_16947:240-911(+)
MCGCTTRSTSSSCSPTLSSSRTASTTTMASTTIQLRMMRTPMARTPTRTLTRRWCRGNGRALSRTVWRRSSTRGFSRRRRRRRKRRRGARGGHGSGRELSPSHQPAAVRLPPRWLAGGWTGRPLDLLLGRMGARCRRMNGRHKASSDPQQRWVGIAVAPPRVGIAILTWPAAPPSHIQRKRAPLPRFGTYSDNSSTPPLHRPAHPFAFACGQQDRYHFYQQNA